jgi:hypothetical protein
VKTFWIPVLIFNDLRLTNPSNPRRRAKARAKALRGSKRQRGLFCGEATVHSGPKFSMHIGGKSLTGRRMVQLGTLGGCSLIFCALLSFETGFLGRLAMRRSSLWRADPIQFAIVLSR